MAGWEGFSSRPSRMHVVRISVLLGSLAASLGPTGPPLSAAM